MEVISRGVLVDFSGAAFLRTDATGEVTEMVSRERHVGVQCFADRLAVVPGLGDGQLFQVGFDTVGDFQQHQGAVLHRGLAPGISGSVGGIQSVLDILDPGAREFGDDFSVDRRCVDEILTLDRRNEFTTDEVAITWLERNDGTFFTGLGVNHERPL